MQKIIRTTFVVLFIIQQFSLVAQNIKGRISDAENGTGISYANVYIMELQTGTRADSSGYFELYKIPAKNVTLQISAIGFGTIHLEVDASTGDFLKVSLNSSHVELSEIVVSTPTGKLSSDNTQLVTQREISELERSSSNSLMESVSNLPGVDQISTGTGIGKPVIRGLTGNRVVTYAQGIRVENQQWGSEHGLGVGSAGIDGVEVLKGPNSLLYGSDAIGGVLYFTDEDYASVNSVEGYAESRFLSASLASQNQVGLKIHKGKYKQNFFGSYKSATDYSVPSGDRVVNTRFDEKNFKTALGYNNNFWVTNLRYSYLENNFGITEEDSLYHQSTIRKPLLPFQNIVDHMLSSENIFFIGKTKLEATFGYATNRRKEYEDSEDTASLDMNLRTLSYNIRIRLSQFHSFKVIMGLQGMFQSNENSGEEVLIPDARTNDFGIYGLLQKSMGKLELQGGLRWDIRELDGLETSFGGEKFDALSRNFSNVNSSLGALYKITENIDLRANLSNGFRAPNTSELLSDGEHEGSNRYEVGNPDLKNEIASQVEMSMSYTNEHIDISINPFLNSIGNYIYLKPEDSVIDGKQLYRYEQTDANLLGVESSIHFHPHDLHWLHIESSYSYIIGSDANGQALPLMPANNLNSTVKAELSGKRRLRLSDFFVQHIYKFSQNRTSEAETPSDAYQLVNLGFTAGLYLEKSKLELRAGVNNAFNQTFVDHLSRLKSFGVSGPARNLFAGLRFEF